MRKSTPVTIGDQQFECAPLSIGALRELTRAGHFAALASMAEVAQGREATPEQLAQQLDATIAIVSAALIKHHPECTPEWVADNVNASEAAPILGHVLTAAGFQASEGNGGPERKSP